MYFLRTNDIKECFMGDVINHINKILKLNGETFKKYSTYRYSGTSL